MRGLLVRHFFKRTKENEHPTKDNQHVKQQNDPKVEIGLKLDKNLESLQTMLGEGSQRI